MSVFFEICAAVGTLMALCCIGQRRWYGWAIYTLSSVVWMILLIRVEYYVLALCEMMIFTNSVYAAIRWMSYDMKIINNQMKQGNKYPAGS